MCEIQRFEAARRQSESNYVQRPRGTEFISNAR
jgi:hypothetical protein